MREVEGGTNENQTVPDSGLADGICMQPRLQVNALRTSHVSGPVAEGCQLPSFLLNISFAFAGRIRFACRLDPRNPYIYCAPGPLRVLKFKMLRMRLILAQPRARSTRS